jgi:hypothetical protein
LKKNLADLFSMFSHIRVRGRARVCAAQPRLREANSVGVLSVVVLLLFSFGAGAPTVTFAQHAEPSPVMKMLVASMAGAWTGTATMMNQQGRHQAKSWEKVESRLQNLVLTVHGGHVDATDTTQVVHEAVGMFFFDATTQNCASCRSRCRARE